MSDLQEMTPLLIWALMPGIQVGIGLAAFRIYRIAGVDSITEPFHGRLNASRHPVGQWFSELVSCPWCIGFWASVAISGVGWGTGAFTWLQAIIIALGASTVCGVVGSIDKRLQEV